MKHIHTFEMIVVAIAVLVGAAYPVNASETAWSTNGQIEALPPLVLQSCIAVEQVMGRNPFARTPDDFVLVKKYEERPETKNHARAIPHLDEALNVYLVQSLLLENPPVGIIYDNTLVVKVSARDSETEEESIFEWILVDENGDMLVDNAFFRESISGKDDAEQARELPRDRLIQFQSYYLNAVRILDSRAGKGIGKGCIIS